MEIYGTKIYSVEAIKQLVEQKGLMEIERYLSKAPKTIRDIIFSWCIEEEVEKFKDYERNKKKLNIEKSIDLESNPYEKNDFDKRITTDRLFMYRNDEDVCPIHRESLFNKQIFVIYQESKKYGVLLPCCKKCKRIYITSEKFKNIENVLIEKEIPYHLFEECLGTAENELYEKEFNIYEDINFEEKKKIEIRRLIIYERFDTFCQIHENKLIQKNIVVEGKKGKAHNFMAMCCTKCKRIFMKKIEYQNSKKVFDKKNIEYTWIPAEK